MCVCVCVRACACMCACMHACVCVCVHACMMYDTDQCHIHLNSLWFVCVGWVVFVFPYDALCGLFWWDCALCVYGISNLD